MVVNVALAVIITLPVTLDMLIVLFATEVEVIFVPPIVTTIELIVYPL